MSAINSKLHRAVVLFILSVPPLMRDSANKHFLRFIAQSLEGLGPGLFRSNPHHVTDP